jgi:hypothetical protein
MFHVKQFDREAYLSLLRLWDRKHRLVGRTRPDRLYRESVESLRSLPPALISDALVDLGAGSGILGVPALLEGLSKKVCLIEPLPKKVAFLEAVKAEMRLMGDHRYSNLLIIPLPVQNVSRETLECYLGPDLSSVPVLSRAFSGNLNMKEALRSSCLKENPCYKFFVLDEVKSPKYVLVREEI